MSRIRTVASFAGSSSVAQGLTILSGFLIVRGLAKDDYALYSVVVGVLGAATVISDSGIVATLLARLGAATRGRLSKDGILRAAMATRTRLAAVVIPLLSLWLAFLLLQNGSGVFLGTILTAIAIGTVAPDLTSALYMTTLQVDGRLRQMQLISIATAAGRLVLVVVALSLPIESLPFVMTATLLSAIGRLLLVRQLIARNSKHEAPAVPGSAVIGPEEQEYRKEFQAAMRRTLPQTLGLIAAEQAIFLALTIAGNTEGIADIGALSRFAMFFAIINSVVLNIAAPAIARGVVGRAETLKALRTVGLLYGGIAILYVVATAVFSSQLLWLLGQQYSNLSNELIIMAAGTAVINFGRFGLGGVSHARGWTEYNWVLLPLLVAWGLIALVTVDFSSSLGAVALSASRAIPILLHQVIRFFVGLARLSRES